MLGLTSVAGINHWIETHRPPLIPTGRGKTLRDGSGGAAYELSFNGLIADWYWMRFPAIRRAQSHRAGRPCSTGRLSTLDLKLLYPLLDTATTLDPQFIAVYEDGCVVLPQSTTRTPSALEKALKTIRPNGVCFIIWVTSTGSAKITKWRARLTPPERVANRSRMGAGHERAHAGRRRQRATAREIYTRMYEEADDEPSSSWPSWPLQIDSFEERDFIRKTSRSSPRELVVVSPTGGNPSAASRRAPAR